MTPPKAPSVLVAMSAFKGTLTNLEATEAVCAALKKEGKTPLSFPIGDGGAGTAAAIQHQRGGEFFDVPTTNPWGVAIQAKTLAIPDRKRPRTLYFESSQACGYTLGDRTRPMEASSLGLGTWIRDCLPFCQPDTQLFLGLGDSAISDGGMGMLGGLGFRFHSNAGALTGCGEALHSITGMTPPESLPPFPLTVLCDVQNPMLGPTGSAPTFAPQKGATPEQVQRLARGLENLERIWVQTGYPSVGALPYTGSAGALSSAFLACLGAKLVPGATTLLDWLGFEKALSSAQWVISGEGRSDAQTVFGKAPAACLGRAKEMGKKTLLLSGSLGEDSGKLTRDLGVDGCFACGLDPSPVQALENKVRSLCQEGWF